MADLKRERELAEKRKNDPPLELASDHPVRKLISRFRKISDNKLAAPNTDPERGDHVANNVTPSGGNANTKVTNVTEGGQLTGAQKWKSFMAGGGANGAAPTPAEGKNDVTQNNHVAPGNAAPKNVVKQVNVAPTARPAKPVSKWGKLLGKPATIEEKPAEEEKEQLKVNVASPPNNPKLDVSGPVTARSTEGPPLTQRDITCSVTGSSNLSIANEQQLIASLYDIKLEIKEEIEVLNQKMTKIDEQISEILKMFSPSSSPYCSHTPSYMSSHSTSINDSSSSTASNSIVTSPKSSRHSSPQRTHIDRLPQTRIGDSQSESQEVSQTASQEVSRAVTPGSRKDSPRSSQDSSSGSSTSSKRSSPNQSDISNGNSSDSRRPKKRRPSGSRIRVAPLYNEEGEEATTSFISRPAAPVPPNTSPENIPPVHVSPSKDDDNLPVKDRDLDIL